YIGYIAESSTYGSPCEQAVEAKARKLSSSYTRWVLESMQGGLESKHPVLKILADRLKAVPDSYVLNHLIHEDIVLDKVEFGNKVLFTFYSEILNAMAERFSRKKKCDFILSENRHFPRILSYAVGKHLPKCFIDALEWKNGDIVKLTKDENTHPQRENFEVFLQTLISQVLDPNFISEIIKESDEYFLSHVKGIERITTDKKKLLFQQASLEPELLQCAEMYPCVNVMPRKDAELVKCQVCQNVSSDQLVQFYGQVYDQTTLGHRINPDNTKPKVTQFSVCTSCSQKVTLFSRLHHQKYNFFLKCRLKVSAVRGGDDNKESHLILEECLEDNSWVSRMFTEVVEMWNECEWRR
ncbi:glutamine and serine-rich protein 1-like, partial [Limulus polyphemus]|uniref:Glutamine and serine-rich protein 1-like n=1 Tax=Limulus polyphemus TaxID=6850 RepID=A0ABM1TAG0_LIMPO